MFRAERETLGPHDQKAGEGVTTGPAMMRLEEKKERGINRIDSGSTHGWFVRGYRNGKTYSKLFSDLKCGGRERAWDQAREYRDRLLADLRQIPARPRSRRA